MRFVGLGIALIIYLLPATPLWAQPAPPGGGNVAAAARAAPAASRANSVQPSSATAAPVAQPWPRIATRQLAFTIPYNVSTGAAGQRPAEVRLYASSDGGQTWELASRQPADTQKFPFRASSDGSYLFLVRTVDTLGQLQPPGPARPELEVVVDTQLPEMSLEASVGPAGELRASWTIADPNLAAETFSLQYQSDPDGQWQTVAVKSPRTATTAGEQSGSTMWWSRGLTQRVKIRAEVRDWAGNSTVRHSTVDVPRIAGQQDDGGAPPAEKRAAARAVAHPRGSYPQTQLQEVQPPAATGGDRTAQAAPPRTAAPTAADNVTHDAVAHARPRQSGVAWPASAGSDKNVWQGNPAPPVAGATDRTPASDSVTAHKANLDNALTDRQRYPSQTAVTQPPIARQAESFVAAREVPSAPPPASGPLDTGGLPPGERPTMTASRRFQLEYDVDSVGPSGVRRVELWETRDAGRNWKPAGVDDDNRSPLIVEPPDEGIYGYRIVVESGNGLTSHPPRPGDLAEIWVGVDWTKPTARLTSAIYGSGSRAGELEIHWEANDARLADRPVAILFAPSPGGPWSPIASGLPNSGVYRWVVDNRVPPSIYLRLEVRDAAGNVAVHELARPIANDGLVPQGRILRIEPTPEETRRGLTGWPAWR